MLFILWYQQSMVWKRTQAKINLTLRKCLEVRVLKPGGDNQFVGLEWETVFDFCCRNPHETLAWVQESAPSYHTRSIHFWLLGLPLCSASFLSFVLYLHHPLPQCSTYASDILCSIISIHTLSQIFFPAPYMAPKLICYQTPIPTPQLPTVTCITSSLIYFTHNPTGCHNLTSYIRSFCNHWKSTLPTGTCSQPYVWTHNPQLSTAWPTHT